MLLKHNNSPVADLESLEGSVLFGPVGSWSQKGHNLLLTTFKPKFACSWYAELVLNLSLTQKLVH